MKNIIPISKFKEGQVVQGFYLCLEKKLRHTRTGELYIDIVLRDRTGQVQAKIWNKVKEYDAKFSAGDAVACLLYTSPSPRDGLLSRMPSSA